VPPLKVLEFVRHFDGVWNLPPEHVDRLRREFPSVSFSSPPDQAEADRELPDADVVFGWAVNKKNLATAGRLKWVHVSAAGVTPLLFPEMVASPIVITNGRGLHAASMAEHTIGVLLAFTRKLHFARDMQRERRWGQEELYAGGPEFGQLEGTTLGLIGPGAVGRAIAGRARALGMRVIAVRRHPDRTAPELDAAWGIERLPELLEQSDWVVIAAPLTPETRGMIGAPEIARLRRSAVLVNLGRGALVDEGALTQALERGEIAGAALDVFEREPLPESSPLWSMPQVIVTPHVSGFGPRYWSRGIDLFGENLKRWIQGEPLQNVVDKSAGY
jgi:phosphoglycerate dehydrogenase-like enzyme